MAVPLTIIQIAAREWVRLVITCAGPDLTIFDEFRASHDGLLYAGHAIGDQRAVIAMQKDAKNARRYVKRDLASLVSGLRGAL